MKKRLPLTSRQKEIWDYLLEWREDYGIGTSPTRQEIGDAIGFSKQWVDENLQKMVEKKYIMLPRGKYRNIVILK